MTLPHLRQLARVARNKAEHVVPLNARYVAAGINFPQEQNQEQKGQEEKTTAAGVPASAGGTRVASADNLPATTNSADSEPTFVESFGNLKRSHRLAELDAVPALRDWASSALDRIEAFCVQRLVEWKGRRWSRLGCRTHQGIEFIWRLLRAEAQRCAAIQADYREKQSRLITPFRPVAASSSPPSANPSQTRLPRQVKPVRSPTVDSDSDYEEPRRVRRTPVRGRRRAARKRDEDEMGDDDDDEDYNGSDVDEEDGDWPVDSAAEDYEDETDDGDDEDSRSRARGKSKRRKSKDSPGKADATDLEERRPFTKHAKQVLDRWLQAHWQDPYPTAKQKRKLARKAGISYDQVQHWFINNRLRRWKPAQTGSGSRKGRNARGKTSKQERLNPSPFFAEAKTPLAELLAEKLGGTTKEPSPRRSGSSSGDGDETPTLRKAKAVRSSPDAAPASRVTTPPRGNRTPPTLRSSPRSAFSSPSTEADAADPPVDPLSAVTSLVKRGIRRGLKRPLEEDLGVPSGDQSRLESMGVQPKRARRESPVPLRPRALFGPAISPQRPSPQTGFGGGTLLGQPEDGNAFTLPIARLDGAVDAAPALEPAFGPQVTGGGFLTLPSSRPGSATQSPALSPKCSTLTPNFPRAAAVAERLHELFGSSPKVLGGESPAFGASLHAVELDGFSLGSPDTAPMQRQWPSSRAMAQQPSVSSLYEEGR